VSKNFIWRCQYATRENKKGRTKGGIITDVRKGIEEVEETEKINVNGIKERNVESRRENLEDNNDI